MEKIAEILQENAQSLRNALISLTTHRNEVGRAKGFKSSEVKHLDKKIRKLNHELQSMTGTSFEATDVDGEDEFDFNIGGDDADSEMGDKLHPSDDDTDFDSDEDDAGFGDELDDDDFDSDEDDEDDEDEDSNFGDEFDDDDVDFDDEDEEGSNVSARLDDLEDKLNTILSRFAEVLANDMSDDEEFDDEDEEEFDDEDEDEDDLDFDSDDDQTDGSPEDDIDFREALVEDGEDEDSIIELGHFVRNLIKAGNAPSYSVFVKALEYIQQNPQLDVEDAAHALSTLAEGRLEQLYQQLKDNNSKVSNYF